MSFTLILAEVLDFFKPLKYSINNNVFKIKVKRSFLILSKKRALLFFLRSLDLEKVVHWRERVRLTIVKLYHRSIKPSGGLISMILCSKLTIGTIALTKGIRIFFDLGD